MIAHAHTTDAMLMRRIANGDERAFSAIWDRYHGLVRHLLSELSWSDQDDVVQDVAIAIWTSAGRYNPRLGSVACWLRVIVRNRGVDRLRKCRYHVGIGEESSSYQFNPIGPLIEQEQFDKAISRVGPELWLQIRGCANRDISDSIGMRFNTVKTRILRNRLNLKAAMAS